MAESTANILLGEAYLEQAIQDTHFFNGRLLTAGDLRHLQEASRLRDHQLGRALGTGVACGLHVRLRPGGAEDGTPVLVVTKGLAINRLGQAIALPQDAEVLLDQPESAPVPKSGYFETCQPPERDGRLVPGKGAYLFVVRPALGFKGLAPRRGFGQAVPIEGCDRDLLIEGAQFRLVEIDVNELGNLSEATRRDLAELLEDVEESAAEGLAAQNKLRNWLAHACFGTEELLDWPRDPFARQAGSFFDAVIGSPFSEYGVLDELRGQCAIDDCDVPLALICWTRSGVKWVDMWSVRRRLALPAHALPWPPAFNDRRQAEGEAILLQFQEQVSALVHASNTDLALARIEARQFFRYLPAVGLLPIASGSGTGTLSYDTFFHDMTVRQPIFIEGAQLPVLLQESVVYPPIDVDAQTVVWLYTVRENAQALLGMADPAQGYIVFASGHTPYRGEPRYDVHHWDFGNLA